MFVRLVFGLLLGSFVNVLGARYREDEFLFSKRVLGGRSYCPHCKKTLEWYELIPLLSFLVLRGKCRSCGGKISFKYPLIELISGFIFAFVPLVTGGDIKSSAFWITTFLVLLLIALIDFRLSIIPDELNILLFVLGVLLLVFNIPSNFVGQFSILFGFGGSRFVSHILAMLLLGLIFGLIILLTKNRGMGMGDLKLALPLGLIFGWPGGLILVIFSFILGAILGLTLIVLKKKNRKQHIPFGPFLALGAVTLFFFGEKILYFYFQTLMGFAANLLGA